MAAMSDNVKPAFSFPTFANNAKVGHPRFAAAAERIKNEGGVLPNPNAQ